MAHCTKCGAKLPDLDTAAFCMSCGEPLPKINTAAQAPGTPAGQQTMPPAQQSDLLDLIEKAQGQSEAPASILPVEGAQPQALETPAGNAPLNLFDEAAEEAPATDLFGAEAALQQPAATSAPQQAPPAPAQQHAPRPAQHQARPAAQQPPAPQRQPAQQPPVQQPVAAPPAQTTAGFDLFDTPPQQAESQAAPTTAAQIQQRIMAGSGPIPPVPPPVQPQQMPPQQKPAYPTGQAYTPPPMPPQRPAPQPPRPVPPAYAAAPMPEKKRSAGKTVVTIIIFFVIFIILLAGATLGFLWFQNRPAKTVDAFIAAVAAGDAGTLAGSVAVVDQDGQPVTPKQDQWEAFCAAFETNASTATLKDQLLALADNPSIDTSQLAYPAVGIESEPFLLFLNRYRITISTVELLAPGAATGSTMRLNNTTYTGTTTPDGELYTGLMPGRYTCYLVPPGTDAATVQPVELELFMVDGPNLFSGNEPRVTLTISNCLSDEAVLYINEQQVDSRPQNGVVTLHNVTPGSIIRISLMHEGQAMEATVVFDNPEVTELRFENYTPAATPPPGISTPSSSSSQAESGPPAEPTEAELNELLAVYYRSYLECINAQNMTPLKQSTASHADNLESRVTSDDNKPFTFQYLSAAVDAQSVTVSQDGLRIRFNAAFRYSYTPREGGDTTEGGNTQTIELLWQDGQWLVNRMVFVSEGDFKNHILADL